MQALVVEYNCPADALSPGVLCLGMQSGGKHFVPCNGRRLLSDVLVTSELGGIIGVYRERSGYRNSPLSLKYWKQDLAFQTKCQELNGAIYLLL